MINYDLPEQTENYVHRVGRTGRGDKFGKSISFCSKEERPLLQEIETYLTKPINELTIDAGTYKETIKMTSDHTQESINSLISELQQLEEIDRKKNKSKKNKR